MLMLYGVSVRSFLCRYALLMRILGIDPGGTTGVCVIEHLPANAGDAGLELLYWDQLEASGRGGGYVDLMQGELAIAERLAGLVGEWMPDLVMMEDFILRPDSRGRVSTTDRSGLSPVRIMSMFEVWLFSVIMEEGVWSGQYGRALPSECVGMVSDLRLKRLGLWVRGQEHVRSAVRVALVGGMRIRDKNT